jgi:arylsulfatase A-like enzyme
MTTAPDIAPTILDLVGVGHPATMTGETFGSVLLGEKDEHRSFVVSSWPLYLAEGEITTAVDSKARCIASYLPVTVTTPDRAVILGGPDDPPELYDLEKDPRVAENVWNERPGEGEEICEEAIAFLERQRTPEEYLAPRRQALENHRAAPRGLAAEDRMSA